MLVPDPDYGLGNCTLAKFINVAVPDSISGHDYQYYIVAYDSANLRRTSGNGIVYNMNNQLQTPKHSIHTPDMEPPKCTLAQTPTGASTDLEITCEDYSFPVTIKDVFSKDGTNGANRKLNTVNIILESSLTVGKARWTKPAETGTASLQGSEVEWYANACDSQNNCGDTNSNQFIPAADPTIDTEPPQISDLQYSPENPIQGDIISFYAVISDDKYLANASLMVDIGETGTFFEAQAIDLSGETARDVQFDIFGDVNTTTNVLWKIVANDESGKSAESAVQTFTITVPPPIEEFAGKVDEIKVPNRCPATCVGATGPFTECTNGIKSRVINQCGQVTNFGCKNAVEVVACGEGGISFLPIVIVALIALGGAGTYYFMTHRNQLTKVGLKSGEHKLSPEGPKMDVAREISEKPEMGKGHTSELWMDDTRRAFAADILNMWQALPEQMAEINKLVSDYQKPHKGEKETLYDSLRDEINTKIDEINEAAEQAKQKAKEYHSVYKSNFWDDLKIYLHESVPKQYPKGYSWVDPWKVWEQWQYKSQKLK